MTFPLVSFSFLGHHHVSLVPQHTKVILAQDLCMNSSPWNTSFSSHVSAAEFLSARPQHHRHLSEMPFLTIQTSPILFHGPFSILIQSLFFFSRYLSPTLTCLLLLSSFQNVHSMRTGVSCCGSLMHIHFLVQCLGTNRGLENWVD